MKFQVLHIVGVLVLSSLYLGGCGTTPDTVAATSDQVQAAQSTLGRFVGDPDAKWFKENMPRAKGILISSRLSRGGFVVGGSGGEAVLLARDGQTGRWVGPAFYNM